MRTGWARLLKETSSSLRAAKLDSARNNRDFDEMQDPANFSFLTK